MGVEQQKIIADEIYAKLQVIDPYCILAGGAPRDWYFGNPANDLDFYFYSNGSTIGAVRKQLEAQFGTVQLLMDRERCASSPLYKTMEDLVRIWEMEYQGQKVQMIQLGNPRSTFKVVDKMDVSVCQVWYIGGEVKLSENFKLTLASNIMFPTTEGYSWSDPHAQKMITRFKGKFQAGTKEIAQDVVIRKALQTI